MFASFVRSFVVSFLPEIYLSIYLSICRVSGVPGRGVHVGKGRCIFLPIQLELSGRGTCQTTRLSSGCVWACRLYSRHQRQCCLLDVTSIDGRRRTSYLRLYCLYLAPLAIWCSASSEISHHEPDLGRRNLRTARVYAREDDLPPRQTTLAHTCPRLAPGREPTF